MVGARRVCRDDWGHAGHQVGEDANLDTALEDRELDIERGYLICEALESLSVQRIELLGRSAHIAKALECPASCTVHSQSRSPDMCRYFWSDPKSLFNS